MSHVSGWQSRLTRLSVIVFLVLLATIGFAQQAAAPVAQQAPIQPSISLSPAVVMARGTFGQGLTPSLTLSNLTARDFYFEMVANDVIVKDGKREFADAGQRPNSIAATAVFSQSTGVVKAGNSATVDVRVTVPATTDIRAIVAIFRGTQNLANKDASVGMTASLGTLLTFNLTDHVGLEAPALKVVAPTATTALQIVQSLENKGSEPVLPGGVAAFLDSNGKLSAKVQFPQQRLLPGEKLDFTAEYAGDLRPGTYRVLCSFEYEGKTLNTETSYTAE
jgi:hypothetical protein